MDGCVERERERIPLNSTTQQRNPLLTRGEPIPEESSFTIPVTGLPAYSDTGYSDTLATKTVLVSKIETPYSENHRIE